MDSVSEQNSEEKMEVTGNWRKLHNEELHNLYSSPNKEDEMDKHIGCMREIGNAYRI
jgi:hypothetical protein